MILSYFAEGRWMMSSLRVPVVLLALADATDKVGGFSDAK